MLSSTCLCRNVRSVVSRNTASRCQTQHRAFRHRAPRRFTAASAPVDPPTTAADEEEEFEGLLPEEDVTVPGTLQDALNPNTKLGKAVKAAVEELEHLNKLEAEVMAEYNSKLQQLGINFDIFAAPAAPAEQEGDASTVQADASAADPSAASGSSDPSTPSS